MVEDTTRVERAEGGSVVWWRTAPLGFRVIVAIVVLQLLGSVAELLFGSDPVRVLEVGAAKWLLGLVTTTGADEPYAVHPEGATGMLRASAAAVFHLAALVMLAGRLRWATNIAFTGWAAFAAAMSISPTGYTSALVAWVLLLAPRTQLFLSSVDAVPWRTPTTTRAKAAGVALLSALLPGLGQAVQRRWLRALGLCVVWAVAAVLHLRPVWTLLVLFAASDAYWRERGPGRETEPPGDSARAERPAC